MAYRPINVRPAPTYGAFLTGVFNLAPGGASGQGGVGSGPLFTENPQYVQPLISPRYPQARPWIASAGPAAARQRLYGPAGRYNPNGGYGGLPGQLTTSALGGWPWLGPKGRPVTARAEEKTKRIGLKAAGGAYGPGGSAGLPDVDITGVRVGGQFDDPCEPGQHIVDGECVDMLGGYGGLAFRNKKVKMSGGGTTVRWPTSRLQVARRNKKTDAERQAARDARQQKKEFRKRNLKLNLQSMQAWAATRGGFDEPCPPGQHLVGSDCVDDAGYGAVQRWGPRPASGYGDMQMARYYGPGGRAAWLRSQRIRPHNNPFGPQPALGGLPGQLTGTALHNGVASLSGRLSGSALHNGVASMSGRFGRTALLNGRLDNLKGRITTLQSKVDKIEARRAKKAGKQEDRAARREDRRSSGDEGVISGSECPPGFTPDFAGGCRPDSLNGYGGVASMSGRFAPMALKNAVRRGRHGRPLFFAPQARANPCAACNNPDDTGEEDENGGTGLLTAVGLGVSLIALGYFATRG